MHAESTGAPHFPAVRLEWCATGVGVLPFPDNRGTSTGVGVVEIKRTSPTERGPVGKWF